MLRVVISTVLKIINLSIAFQKTSDVGLFFAGNNRRNMKKFLIFEGQGVVNDIVGKNRSKANFNASLPDSQKLMNADRST